MGYDSRLTGRIAITPPLRWADVRASRFLKANNRASSQPSDVVFDIQVEDTDDGTVQQAIAIVPADQEAFSRYTLDEDLAEIAREVIGLGSYLDGYIVREGEEQGDVERYHVEDGAGPVVSEKASLRWPDGTEVQA